jgi:hypothetical protein
MGELMPITVTPGDVPDDVDKARADMLQVWRAGELASIRAAGEKWQAGLAALLGLVTTILVIKGRESGQELATGFRVAIGLCLLVALLTAIAASLAALRAAHGLPRARAIADRSSVLMWDRQEAAKASRALLIAIVGTVSTLLLLAASVGLTWFAPATAQPVVKVTQTDGATGCGELISADAKLILLKGHDRDIRINPRNLGSMSVDSAC